MKNKKVIKLSEYSEALLPISLTDEDRIYLHEASLINEKRPWEKRFYVDELINGVRLKTTSFVGTIEISSYRIIIQPKFKNNFVDVMKMIAFSEDDPFTVNRETKVSLEKSDFFILLANQFLSMAERIVFQLKKDYVLYKESLKSVRGRIQMLETAKTHYLLPTAVVCEYDELNTDILENQIILTVLRKIEKHPDFRGKPQLLRVLRPFETFCRHYEGKKYPSFSYNRLNQHYEPIHKIGKLLFEGLFNDNFQGKSDSFMTVLIDMNELFERFIMQMFKKFLPKNYIVSHGKQITDAITRDDKSYRYIIPDIVVTNKLSKETNIIDTKYKNYDFKKIETDDIFQLTFYAQYFQKSAPCNSMIIHPVFDGYQEHSFNIDTNKHSVPGKITVQSIQIEEILHWIETKQFQKLKEKSLQVLSI